MSRSKTRPWLRLESLEDRKLLSGPGDLDPTFGNGGIALTSFTKKDVEWGTALAIQADGRIVAVGGAGMARYNTNGTLDSSFGAGGKVSGVGGPTAKVDLYPAGTADAGKIVTLANFTVRNKSQFGLTRFNANGSVDTSFGAKGNVATDFGVGSDSLGRDAVAVQPDGKVIAAGNNAFSFILERYNANGSLDASFGNGGKALTPPSAEANLYDIALQPDGKIVAVGGISYGPDKYDFAVARFNANGTLDTGFGPAHTGIVQVIDMLADHPGVGTEGWSDRDSMALEAHGVAIQPDGAIVAVGQTRGNSLGDGWLVARFDTAGNLDGTFGIRGTTFIKPSDLNYEDQARAVAIQADGGIVVTGTTDNASGFHLARLESAGNLDATFGVGGIVRTPVSSGTAQSMDLALQANGSIVVVGSGSSASTGSAYALARYLGSATVTARAFAQPVATSGTSTDSPLTVTPGNHATHNATTVMHGNRSAHNAGTLVLSPWRRPVRWQARQAGIGHSPARW